MEKRKLIIITELYNTGRLDGEYFGRKSASTKNPIKEYIKSCLYKTRIAADSDLIDDCYNHAFMYVSAMSAEKLCGLYDESKSKLIATVLRIIALKCFAQDGRLGRPNHSLIEGVKHASVFKGNNVTLPTSEYHDDADNSMYNMVLVSDDEPDDFTKLHGYSIEDVLNELTPQEKATFYEQIGTQPRGKQSAVTKAQREALRYKLLAIKHTLDIIYN